MAVSALMASILPSLITGGSMVGTSLISNLFGMSQANKANEYNRENLNLQFQHMKDMQQRQMDYQTAERLASQDYNTPANQAKLYAAAGMSPLAMLDKGQSFVPTTAQSGGQGSAPSAAPFEKFLPDFSGLTGAVASFFDTQEKQQNVELLKTQNEFARAKTIQELVEQRVRIANEEKEGQFKSSTLRYLDKQIEILSRSADDMVLQNKESARATSIMADQSQLDYENSVITRQIDVAQKEANYNLSVQQIKELNSRISLLWEQCKTERMSQKEIKWRMNSAIMDVCLKGQNYDMRKHMVNYYNEHPEEAKGLYRFQQYLDPLVDMLGTGAKFMPKR